MNIWNHQFSKNELKNWWFHKYIHSGLIWPLVKLLPFQLFFNFLKFFGINLTFFKGMSGAETVHYIHFMNWVRQLPGTDIRDYDRSQMKVVVQTCLEVIFNEVQLFQLFIRWNTYSWIYESWTAENWLFW